MRTGVLNKTPIYKIDFYNEKKYRDLQEHSNLWDISLLPNHLYLDEKSVESNRNIHITMVENMWLQNAERLHMHLGAMIKDILKSIENTVNLNGSKTLLQMYWGEYLGKSNYIFTWRGKDEH